MKTRRQAIQSALAVATVPLASAQEHQHQAPLVELKATKKVVKFFSIDEMKTMSRLVDMIIPRTDTPGAADANVHYIIDGNARTRAKLGADLRRGIASLNGEARKKNGRAFVDLSEPEQVAILTAFSKEEETSRAAFFKLLKDATVDGYYSTKEGLQQELGWNANTFLKEFPGCTHPEHQV
jgi:Gluconate 2-dehydrogenase subunit 3